MHCWFTDHLYTVAKLIMYLIWLDKFSLLQLTSTMAGLYSDDGMLYNNAYQ